MNPMFRVPDPENDGSWPNWNTPILRRLLSDPRDNRVTNSMLGILGRVSGTTRGLSGPRVELCPGASVPVRERAP